jgi:hypothetical protein
VASHRFIRAKGFVGSDLVSEIAAASMSRILNIDITAKYVSDNAGFDQSAMWGLHHFN